MPGPGPTHQPPTSNPEVPTSGPLGVRTEPSCKTCNSRHRDEIETRLLAGQSTRSVSAWLETTHSEVIRYDAVLRHKKAHINPGLEAARQIQAARAESDEALPAKADPVAKPPPAPAAARAAKGRPAKPAASAPPPKAAKAHKPAPGVAPAYAAEVVRTVADVTLIDLLAQEALTTMRSVAVAIQQSAGQASFAQSAFIVGMTRELVKATQTRHLILSGKSPGANGRALAQDALNGLKGMLANGAPPAIEGDDPDDAEESTDGLIGDGIGDLTTQPRWADGEPETDPDREVVEAPAPADDTTLPGAEARQELVTVDSPPVAPPVGAPTKWKNLWQPPPLR